MATIDVSGRQGRMYFGKGRPTTAPSNVNGSLTASRFGLCSAARGADEMPAGRRHVDPITVGSYTKAAGKKMVEVEHALPTDEAKRRAGKFGLRKVKPAVHPERPRREVPTSEAKPRANHTAEEKAEIALRRLAAQGVTVAKDVVEGRRPASSRDALLQAEKLAAKEAMTADRLAQQEQAADSSVARRPRTADFASKASLDLPFATVQAKPMPDPKFVSSRKSCIAPESKEMQRSFKKPAPDAGAPHATPFDTVERGIPYPDPPEPGVRRGTYTHHAKKTCEGRGHTTTLLQHNDADSLSIARGARKADARGASVLPDRSQDFIFGVPPPPPAPAKRTHGRDTTGMLSHDIGASAQANAQVHHGRGLAAMHHQKTRLW